MESAKKPGRRGLGLEQSGAMNDQISFKRLTLRHASLMAIRQISVSDGWTCRSSTALLRHAAVERYKKYSGR
jgi:hypothetical protein